MIRVLAFIAYTLACAAWWRSLTTEESSTFYLGNAAYLAAKGCFLMLWADWDERRK